jgi:hypothetical protein
MRNEKKQTQNNSEKGWEREVRKIVGLFRLYI